MPRKKSLAETNHDILTAIKDGEAKVYTEPNGKKTVKKSAPNLNKKCVRRSFLGNRIFYNCPKCGKPLQFRSIVHQNLCMRCGQRLEWNDLGSMNGVWLDIHDAEEAAYWGGQYEAINGTLYQIDLEKWRLDMTKKNYPTRLFFPFPDGKAYGRFMRKASKEAKVIK